MKLLENLISAQSIPDTESLKSLAKKGMLVGVYEFSTPVMAGYASQKIVGMPPKRAEKEPETLEDLIIFVLWSLN